jgi:trans-aconitate 2-methyltransferase
MTGRSWDAGAYHRVSGPMVEMAMRVLDRLPLRGDEHVMDAGCGTGRVTAALAERLPEGHVLAVDADPAMVAAARQALAPYGERVTVQQADLLQLDLDEAVDGILSTATFHWVLDHDRLFANMRRALRPGGHLVAQWGGFGNVASILRAADEAASLPPWRDRFEGWSRPTLYATADDTRDRLLAVGFDDVRCWLEPNPVVPDEPREYLAAIVLGAHLQRLAGDGAGSESGPAGDAEQSGFLDEVLARLSEPVTVDYVRLNVDARRPG